MHVHAAVRQADQGGAGGGGGGGIGSTRFLRSPRGAKGRLMSTSRGDVAPTEQPVVLLRAHQHNKTCRAPAARVCPW